MSAAPETPLVEQLFTAEDNARFASLSGDRNPIHLDPVTARRTQVGAPVVHGMHTLLWCLDALAGSPFAPGPPASLQMRFSQPIHVGARPSIRFARRSDDEILLHVELDGSPAAMLTVRLRTSTEDVEACGASVEREIANVAPSPLPRDLALDEIAGQSGRLAFVAAPAQFTETFPAAARWIGASRLRALAALSWLVGMECPGLHSIFSGLSIAFGPSDDGVPSYRVKSVDDRFRLVQMQISDGGISGTVDAFVRQPPAAQPSMGAIARLVEPHELVGQQALVVGGSRGLGELTAKIIAAAGGHPTITWAAGEADALRVQAEIAAFGGTCDFLRYDATMAATPQLSALKATPTHLYYFATCRIAGRKPVTFDTELFERFQAFYVEGYSDLVEALTAHSRSLTVFCPSSVFVENPPREFTEYARAKEAAEIRSAELASRIPNLRMVSRRLPRMATDQTASIIPVEMTDALSIMLPIVREVQATR